MAGLRSGPAAKDRLDEMEETGFVLKLQFYFEPSQRQRRNQVFEMRRAVNAILLRGNQDFRAVRARLMRQALHFDRLIDVMIREAPLKDNIQAERGQRLPKVFGISKCTKGGDAMRVQIRQALPGKMVTPAARYEASAEDGRVTIVEAEPLLNSVKARVRFRARNHENTGALQGVQRLTKPA